MATSHSDVLWRVIARFDEYIRAADNKAAVVATFAVFEFGVALERSAAVLEREGGAGQVVALLALGLAVALALCALAALISAVLPNLASQGPDADYRSVLFFGDVAGDDDGTSYERRVAALDDARTTTDLAHQAHALAGIAERKYGRLSKALWAVSAAVPILALGLILSVLL